MKICPLCEKTYEFPTCKCGFVHPSVRTEELIKQAEAVEQETIQSESGNLREFTNGYFWSMGCGMALARLFAVAFCLGLVLSIVKMILACFGLHLFGDY